MTVEELINQLMSQEQSNEHNRPEHQTCPFCNGRGEDKNGYECSTCSGTGEVST